MACAVLFLPTPRFYASLVDILKRMSYILQIGSLRLKRIRPKTSMLFFDDDLVRPKQQSDRYWMNGSEDRYFQSK